MELLKYVYLYAQKSIIKAGNNKFQDLINAHRKLRPGERGRLLVNLVPMREQRTTKIFLKSVFDNLKLIPLFTVSSQKVTLSNVVN